MIYNIFVGRTLYFTTKDCAKAFKLFRAWAGTPPGVSLQFLPLKAVSS
jgi:hypothetical protein